jgi:hypothetical protein
MVRSAACVMRMSAGMRSPVWKSTRSPGTSNVADMVEDFLSAASNDRAVSLKESNSMPSLAVPFGALLLGDGSAPARMMCAEWGTSWFSASIDFSDRYSCTKPTVTTMVTAIVMLTASSKLPMMTETPAEPSSRRISVSLNCLTKRSHSGSDSSCGSSLWPWTCMRADASDAERPWVTEV